MIYGWLFSFDDENDEALSDYFANGGFSSRNALRNMGSTAIFLTLNVGLLLVMWLSDVLGIERFHAYLSKKYKWNHFLRTAIQQYLTIVTASLI